MESEPTAGKLKGMYEAPSPPPPGTVIPNSDWEQTPMSVKQWVESREERIQELER